MSKSTPVYLYGINTLIGLLENTPQRVVAIYIEQGRKGKRIDEIEQLARQQHIAVHTAQQSVFDKRLAQANHQGVMAECKPAQALSEKSLFIQLAQLEHPAFLLCLDGVQDPHNLGACLRSADAAGVDAVIVPKDNACGLNATVSKVASGAAESMPFFAVTNLSRCLREIQQAGIWCVGLAAEAVQSLYTSDLSGPVAIVLGAEGKGLRRLTAQTCDSLVSLPMLGQVSSLNVSVTTGIALFEAVRQRQCG